MHEVVPIDLLAILVDRLFHCPVVVLKPGLKQRNLPASLFLRKEFGKHREHHERCGLHGSGIVVPSRSRPHPIPQEATDVQGSRSPGPSAGKALDMKHQAWASKQLIVSIALALALAPAVKAAESRPPLDEKTRGLEPAAALPELAHQSPGAPQQAAPQPPPHPAAEQQLIQPPDVTYQDGQLTIIAENSLLSEVMKALRAALGGDVDFPAGVADQHIWVHLGPGPARRVLRDLLDGTEFNYVIQASEDDPDGIRSVLLTARSKSTGAEKAGSPERSAIRRMPGTGSDTQSGTDSENPPPEPVASVDPPPAPAPAPPANGASANASSASLQNTLPNSGSSALRPSSATDPNQQIQMLQSMYDQRRQLQIQQNQKATGQN